MKLNAKICALTIIAGISLTSLAHANLILTSDSPLHPPDQTPAGLENFVGTQLGNPNLIDVLQVQRRDGNFIDNAFQVVFNSDRTATVSYDLSGIGVTAFALFVFGPNGGNLYTVPAGELITGGGTVNAPFTRNGNTFGKISHLDFFVQTGGGNAVPETGATAALLGSGLVALGLLRRLAFS